jgi:hypothetical protein
MNRSETRPQASDYATSLPEDLIPLPPDPVIEVYKRDIDRTLLRENLKLTPAQRVLQQWEFSRSVDEMQRAARTKA